jgi:hypothetical protein
VLRSEFDKMMLETALSRGTEFVHDPRVGIDITGDLVRE